MTTWGDKYKRIVIDVTENGFIIRPKSATSNTVHVCEGFDEAKLAALIKDLMQIPESETDE